MTERANPDSGSGNTIGRGWLIAIAVVVVIAVVTGIFSLPIVVYRLSAGQQARRILVMPFVFPFRAAGVANHAAGEYQAALADYRIVFRISRAARDRVGQAVACSNIGDAYRDMGEADSAVCYYVKSCGLYQATAMDEQAARALENAGATLSGWGRIDSAVGFLGRALEIHIALGNRRGEARTRVSIAFAYHAAGRYEPALSSFLKALDRYRSLQGGEAGIEQICCDLGLMRDVKGEQWFCGLRRSHGMSEAEIADLLREIREAEAGQSCAGVIPGDKDDGLKQVLDRYHAALEECRKSGDSAGQARLLNWLGAVHEDRADLDSAFACYVEVLDMYSWESVPDVERILWSLHLLYPKLGEDGFRDAGRGIGLPEQKIDRLLGFLRLIEEPVPSG